MSQTSTHYLVDFASRYARTHFKTLDAASALWRAEALCDDAKAFCELKEIAEQREIRFGARRPGYAVFSYYSVGYVTCLEWHARSRLVDAMLFRPSIIETSDIRGIATVALSQMLAEGVSVPHLMGAATHVSTIEEYVGVFERVFSALGLTNIVEKELKTTRSDLVLFGDEVENNLYNVLADLFRTRNRLVHEIDMSVVGPYTLRDSWSPSRAAEYGNTVIAAIKLVEAKITQHSPHDFPNRLDLDGFPESELEKLESAIASVETELSVLFGKHEDDEFRASWKRAVDASNFSQTLELSFIEEAHFLRPVRYIDLRRSVQIDRLRARLTYLLSLKSEAEQSYEPPS